MTKRQTKRTPSGTSKGRRFEASEQTIYRDLRAIIIKMNALSLKVDYDLLGNDSSVRIYFDRNGKRYVPQGEAKRSLAVRRVAALSGQPAGGLRGGDGGEMSVASLATSGDTAVSPEVAILQHCQK